LFVLFYSSNTKKKIIIHLYIIKYNKRGEKNNEYTFRDV